MTSPELLDARGVPIAAGDTVIYGFGVGRSVAMAEGLVLGEEYPPGTIVAGMVPVSLTPSGRVRLRVVRRSYGGGEKPVVDVAPDRLVVLKPCVDIDGVAVDLHYLPESTLPTQAEERRQGIEKLIGAYTADLRATEVPPMHHYRDWTLERFHAYAADRLAELRKQLKEVEDE